jgi:hypothetical protein
MATDTDTSTAAEADATSEREELHTADLVPGDRDTRGDDGRSATRDARTDETTRTEDAGALRAPEPESASRADADNDSRTDDGDAPMALFDNASDLESRWQEIQVRFVDEPRGAVEQADALVAEVMRQLAETFASERAQMEEEWHAGDQVSTEDLRIALKRYRSFFQRLLAA